VKGVGGRRKQVFDKFNVNERTIDIERGSTISHGVENSLRTRLWTCRKSDY
jgi:hypothetical protein